MSAFLNATKLIEVSTRNLWSFCLTGILRLMVSGLVQGASGFCFTVLAGSDIISANEKIESVV